MKYILKAVFEHASFQMDDDAVFAAASEEEIHERIAACEARWGRPFFAERFVDGREFNLSLLAGAVLPPAEIDFSALPDDQPPIVGYRAKFDAQSFEYHHTPRRFNFSPDDAPLLDELAQQAVACWRLFGLTGFARGRLPLRPARSADDPRDQRQPVPGARVRLRGGARPGRHRLRRRHPAVARRRKWSGRTGEGGRGKSATTNPAPPLDPRMPPDQCDLLRTPSFSPFRLPPSPLARRHVSHPPHLR